MQERQQSFGEKLVIFADARSKESSMTRSGETGHLNGQPCAGSVIAFTVSPIGWGSGQKYEEDEDGEFYLVAGGEPEENDSAKVDQDISVNDILRMFFKS